MSKKKRNASLQPSPVSPLSPQIQLWSSVVWIGGSIWAVLVCLRFFQVQPFPLTTILSLILPSDLKLIPALPTLIDDAVGLFYGVLLFGSAVFVGRLVTRVVFKTTESALELCVISAVLGYGILSYLTLALGALGLYYPLLFRVGIGLLSLIGVFWFLQAEERAWLLQARREKISILFSNGRGFFLAVILIFIFITNFVMVFVPELFYDALVYHLGVPNYYLHEHRLAPLDLMTSKFPFTIQMIHLIGLALKDEMVTRFNHMMMLFLIVGGMMSFGLRIKKPLLGLIAAVLFAAIPTVLLNSMSSGVDVGVSMFGFMAAYAMLVSLENGAQSLGWFILSAVFSGFAVGSKYTAAPLPVAIFLVFIFFAIKEKRSLSWILGRTAMFAGVSILLMAPWLIKNWVETKNPVYPFLIDVFGGLKLEPWRYEILRGENYGHSLKTFKDFFWVFWDLSVHERSSLSFQGPLMLGAVPFVVYGALKEKSAWLVRISMMTGLFILMALFMTRLTRYWMPGLTLASLLVAYGITSLLEEKSFLKVVSVSVIFSMGIWFQLTWVYMLIHNSYQPRNVLLGLQSRDDFISFYHSGMNPNPSEPMFSYLKSHLLPTDKTLLVGTEMAYPIPVRHGYSGVYDRGPLVRLAETSQSSSELAEKLTREGFTHIMVNLAEANRLAGYGIFNFSQKGFGVFGSFWENNLELQYVDQVPIQQGYTNPILLLKVEPKARASHRPVQNVIAPIYEKEEWPRMGIDTLEKRKNFYAELSKDWPGVLLFQQRLAELKAKK